MKHIKFLYLFVLISTFSLAQNSTRIFKNVTKTKNGLEINVNDGIYYITFYNEKIVETSFVPKGEELQNNSHAVVLKKKDLDVISIVLKAKVYLLQKEYQFIFNTTLFKLAIHITMN